MKRQLTTVSLLALLTCGAAHADDWLQFRRDASRSGVSQDKLKFPLTETWTWKTKAKNGHSPLFHAVVRKGKIYFTASEKNTRYLICADARTGKVHWSKPLDAEKLEFGLSDSVGPALTENGRLFVYDWMTAGRVSELVKFFNSKVQKNGDGSFIACNPMLEEISSFAVRAYDTETGQQQAYFPMAAMGANGVLPRLSLIEPFQNAEGQVVRAVPATFAGCPP